MDFVELRDQVTGNGERVGNWDVGADVARPSRFPGPHLFPVTRYPFPPLPEGG